MSAQQDKSFRRTVGSLLAVLVLLGTFSFVKTNTVSTENTKAIDRIQVVEKEVQDIIDQGLLDCPNRAQARHVLRVAILNNPQTPASVRELVESEFKEIKCDPLPSTTNG